MRVITWDSRFGVEKDCDRNYAFSIVSLLLCCSSVTIFYSTSIFFFFFLIRSSFFPCSSSCSSSHSPFFFFFFFFFFFSLSLSVCLSHLHSSFFFCSTSSFFFVFFRLRLLLLFLLFFLRLPNGKMTEDNSAVLRSSLDHCQLLFWQPQGPSTLPVRRTELSPFLSRRQGERLVSVNQAQRQGRPRSVVV